MTHVCIEADGAVYEQNSVCRESVTRLNTSDGELFKSRDQCQHLHKIQSRLIAVLFFTYKYALILSGGTVHKPPSKDQIWNYVTSNGVLVLTAIVTIVIAQAFVSSCKMRMQAEERAIRFEESQIEQRTP